MLLIVFSSFCIVLFCSFNKPDVVFGAEYSGKGPITGQTPCCFDRLGTLLCARQKKTNLATFLHRCMRNADFAFVQCCRTCFDQQPDDMFKLSYQKTSDFLLSNPETAQCWDRRGIGWCNQFSMGKLFQVSKEKERIDGKKRKRNPMSCANVPIAFRLCRKTCGFCASDEMPVQAVYDERMAKSAARCRNPSKGLAMQRRNSDLVYRDFVSRFRMFESQRKPIKKLTDDEEEEYARKSDRMIVMSGILKPHAPYL